MGKKAIARRERIKAQWAFAQAARTAPVVPMPVMHVRPPEVVVLPVLSFPLRWRDWTRCALCGIGGRMTVDRIRPVSRKGWNCASNRQPLCLWCNQAKANEVVECVQQYERILVESLGRQGRAHTLPTAPMPPLVR